MTDQPTSDLGRAVQEVAEKAQVLVHEEIELAKAEVSQKVSKLVRGIVVGAVAAIFLVGALLFLMHAAAWALWSALSDDPDGGQIWLGFLLLGGILILLGGIAGFVAMRFVKRGTPPTPQMAITEAQLIKQTVSNPQPATLTGTAPASSQTEVRS